MIGGGKGDLPAAFVCAHIMRVDAPLFDTPLGPPGFAYAADIVTPDEEAELLARLADLPFEPFLFRGYEGRRRVISYGMKYDFTGPGLVTATPIPDWLLPVRDRAAAFAGLPSEALSQLLINEYREGAPIGWHRDRPVFDQVVAVSLLSAATLRFRRRAGDRFERQHVPLAPRSVYRLVGPARTDWEHSLPEARAHRFSLTFRNLR